MLICILFKYISIFEYGTAAENVCIPVPRSSLIVKGKYKIPSTIGNDKLYMLG